LEAAYAELVEVAELAQTNRVASNKDVREAIAALKDTLEDRAEQAFDDAKANYFEGDHEASLATYEELTALEELRVSRSAEREIRAEEGRAAYRESAQALRALLDAGDLAQGYAMLRGVQQQGSRAGYRNDVESLLTGFSEIATQRVEQASQQFESGEYVAAYAGMADVASMSLLREPATAARQAMRDTQGNEGMQLAKREYDASRILDEARAKVAEVRGERTQAAQFRAVVRSLDQIAEHYADTQAAGPAADLANELRETLEVTSR